MSESESKSSEPQTPQNVTKSRSSTSTVPTDLTISSTDSSDRALVIHNRRLQQQMALLEIETRKKDTLIEKIRNEYEEKLRGIQNEKEEAVLAKDLAEKNVEIRLAMQSKEMSKIQNAINTQLTEVITRQKHLEIINQKLREKADTAKTRLETFCYDENRHLELSKLPSQDLSLYEFAELIIYKNIIPEKSRLSEAAAKNSQLETKIMKLSDLLTKSDIYMEKMKVENEKLIQLRIEKENDIEDIKKSVHEMDRLNAILQEKLSQYESVKARTQIEKERKDSELFSYKKKNEQLVKDLQHSTLENNLLLDQLSKITKELQNVHHMSDSLGRNTNSGFNRLTSITQAMQTKQLELLDKFSNNVRQNKIDEKYREQYLETIKQLVTEQVRTQHYITQVTCERDQLSKNITDLTLKIKNAQMDLLEEEIKRNKESEKVEYLEKKIIELNKRSQMPNTEEYISVDVKETKEYKMVLNDLKLLLQHKQEISDMKKFMQKLQET